MIFKSKKIYFIVSIIILCVIAFKMSFSNLYILTSANVNWDNWKIEEDSQKKYIKWVDFTPNYEVLSKAAQLDIDSHNNNELVKFNWIELISYLACKYGGNFNKFNTKDLNELVQKMKDR